MDDSSYVYKCFEDWNDDERMGALYGEFRPRNVNPEGWRNKMNIWTNAVSTWCRETRRVSLTLKDLRLAFERKGQFPHCLDQVFQHMVNERTLTNRSLVNANNTSSENESWVNWGINVFVKRPVVWGWNALRQSVSDTSDEESVQEYVHMPLLKVSCISIMKYLTSEMNPDTSTISIADCYAMCKEQCPQFESLLLILKHLQSQGKLLLFVESGTQYVKMCRKIEKKSKVQVTETDVGLLKLQKALQKIDCDVEKLRTDIEGCTNQAKAALKAGQKPKVTIILRRRKLLEKAVEQKLNTAEKLETMIFKLQDTSSSQEVVGALKAGLNAQKEIAAQGMGIDDVEDTLGRIQEAFEDQAEIENILSGPVVGLSRSTDDDSALEQELDDLLEQDKIMKTKQIITPQRPEIFIPDFPDVPVTDPSPPRSATASIYPVVEKF